MLEIGCGDQPLTPALRAAGFTEVHALAEHRRLQRQSLERLLSLPENTYAKDPLRSDLEDLIIQAKIMPAKTNEEFLKTFEHSWKHLQRLKRELFRKLNPVAALGLLQSSPHHLAASRPSPPDHRALGTVSVCSHRRRLRRDLRHQFSRTQTMRCTPSGRNRARPGRRCRGARSVIVCDWRGDARRDGLAGRLGLY